jgi:hypothetical protein
LVFVAIATFVIWGRGQKTLPDAPQAAENVPPIGKNKIAEKENIVKLQFTAPINNPLTRVTKKPFGIYVSPRNSPVTPEKFRGYHTGVDFETFPEEQDVDVSVAAICEGKILEKSKASGYGGVVVQSCSLDNNPITVVYGHIQLASVKNSIGDVVKVGDFLGFLGTGYSAETDGERKHLHLGIHKGEMIDIRGYVNIQSELKDWIDFVLYFSQ